MNNGLILHFSVVEILVVEGKVKVGIWSLLSASCGSRVTCVALDWRWLKCLCGFVMKSGFSRTPHSASSGVFRACNDTLNALPWERRRQQRLKISDKEALTNCREQLTDHNEFHLLKAGKPVSNTSRCYQLLTLWNHALSEQIRLHRLTLWASSTRDLDRRWRHVTCLRN